MDVRAVAPAGTVRKRKTHLGRWNRKLEAVYSHITRAIMPVIT